MIDTSVRATPEISTARRGAALAVLCVSLLVVTLDNTVLNTALPTLVRDLHANDTQLQWIVDAYALVFGGLLLVAGSLADRFGRKWTFLAGLVAFAAGSAWAAFSGSVELLIAARASMGIGGALMMPSTLAIITAMFDDPRQRQRAIGLWAGTSGVGMGIGPIVGGLLLAHFWWGSVFLINVPVAVLGLVCALPLIPDSKNPAAPRPDLVGSLLSVAGLGMLLWAIIEAPLRGWSSAIVIGTGTGGLAVLAGFVLWERASSHPMLNLTLLRKRAFSAAVSSVGLVMFGVSGALFVLTQFLQFGLGFSALQAGIRVLPAAGAIAVVSPLAAILVRMIGTKLTATAGLLVIAGGMWQVALTTASTGYTGILPGMILLGVGAGLVSPAATASVMSSVPPEHTGVGSATNSTFLQIGGALGVAVIGSVLSTRYQDQITDAVRGFHPPQSLLDSITSSIGAAQQVAARIGGTLGPMLADAAKAAFISGMDLGLGIGAAFGLAGALIALFALPGGPRRRTAPSDDTSGPNDFPAAPAAPDKL